MNGGLALLFDLPMSDPMSGLSQANPSSSKRAAKEIAFGLLIIISIYFSAARWLPLSMQDAFFVFTIGFLPIALNVAGWLGFLRARRADVSVPWKRVVATLGLAANSLAIAFPWLFLLHERFQFARHSPVYGGDMIDGLLALKICVALGAFSVVAGFVGPRHIRFSLVFGGLIVCCLSFVIPMGIL